MSHYQYVNCLPTNGRKNVPSSLWEEAGILRDFSHHKKHPMGQGWYDQWGPNSTDNLVHSSAWQLISLLLKKTQEWYTPAT